MKKELIKINRLYHIIDGKEILGMNGKMIGNCSKLYGDCTGLYGDCSEFSGDCTGLYGDLTGLYGDLDDCEITEEDREKGIDINDLIKEETL